MLQKESGIYLVIAPFLTIPVGRLRDLAGTGARIAGCAVFVAIAASFTKIVGAEEARA